MGGWGARVGRMSQSTFQRCKELILKGLQWKTLLIYLDDVIIYSDTVVSRLEQFHTSQGGKAEII